MANLTIIFVFAGIILFGALLCALICSKYRSKRYLNVEYYREKCLSIEHKLKKDDPNTFQLSVINADKLVDQALKELGCKGQTMGERMRDCIDKFSDKASIWEAHKLRNQLVHEPNFTVTYEQARRALHNFRRALKDLGAI